MPSVLSRLRSLFVRGDDTYAARLRSEIETYRDCVDVNDLPQIFHYWSNKYLAPKFAQLGFSHPDQFFAKYLHEGAAEVGGPTAFASVGAGNCDTEVRVAKLLRQRGLANFTIECLDINADMLKRGRDLADAEGVGDAVSFTEADFNRWSPRKRYHAVMANQSLHHVVNLEGLFDAVHRAIDGGGSFVVSDIIGRNGHQRWPEALEIVQEFWQELPQAYRYNRQLKRQEERFLDWDCAVGTFEGIRAQDILPLLVERFEFDVFAPFANLIDPFIDRGFGHNFDAQAEWDKGFIDRVHARDEEEIRLGRIKPTHMMAVMRVGANAREEYLDGLTPRGCIRPT
jgi:ubiquinone/menaquinone biosynthesis C-methylase UbiE